MYDLNGRGKTTHRDSKKGITEKITSIETSTTIPLLLYVVFHYLPVLILSSNLLELKVLLK